jgi:hypothetical protein
MSFQNIEIPQTTPQMTRTKVDIVLSFLGTSNLKYSRKCRQGRRCPQLLRNIVTYRNVQRENLMWYENKGANEIAHEDTWTLGVSCII